MSREEKLNVAKRVYKEIMQSLSHLEIQGSYKIGFYWFGIISVDDDLFSECELKEM